MLYGGDRAERGLGWDQPAGPGNGLLAPTWVGGGVVGWESGNVDERAWSPGASAATAVPVPEAIAPLLPKLTCPLLHKRLSQRRLSLLCIFWTFNHQYARLTRCPTGVRCATLSSGAWADIGARAAAGSAQWAAVRGLVLSTAVAQLAAKAGGGGTESGCAAGAGAAAGEGAETRCGTEPGADTVAEGEGEVLTCAAGAWDKLREEMLALALARTQAGLVPQTQRWWIGWGQ